MDFPIFNLNEFEQETGFKRKKLAANLDLLCQNLGFLIIVDHQISKEIICNQWRAVANFFSQRNIHLLISELFINLKISM